MHSSFIVLACCFHQPCTHFTLLTSPLQFLQPSLSSSPPPNQQESESTWSLPPPSWSALLRMLINAASASTNNSGSASSASALPAAAAAAGGGVNLTLSWALERSAPLATQRGGPGCRGVLSIPLSGEAVQALLGVRV